MTFVFLGSASSRGTFASSPILFKLANPRTSPLVASLQYLASLLFGKGEKTRLQILFSSSHASLEEWEQECTQDVRALRRMVLLTISWLQRRIGDRIDEPPFSLVALSDPKLPENLRQSIARRWDDTNPCCVRPGFAAKMKKRHVSGDDLCSPKPLRLNFQHQHGSPSDPCLGLLNLI